MMDEEKRMKKGKVYLIGAGPRTFYTERETLS